MTGAGFSALGSRMRALDYFVRGLEVPVSVDLRFRRRRPTDRSTARSRQRWHDFHGTVVTVARAGSAVREQPAGSESGAVVWRRRDCNQEGMQRIAAPDCFSRQS